jgi:hypothetical protein
MTNRQILEQTYERTGKWPLPHEFSSILGFPFVPYVRARFLTCGKIFLADKGALLKLVTDRYSLMYAWVDRTECLTLFGDEDMAVQVASILCRIIDDKVGRIFNGDDAGHVLDMRQTDENERTFLECSDQVTRCTFLDIVYHFDARHGDEWAKLLLEDGETFMPSSDMARCIRWSAPSREERRKRFEPPSVRLPSS